MRAQLTSALLAAAVIWCASPASAQLDATCVASMTINFDPPAMIVLPPNPAPLTTGTGGGTITGCVVSDQGPTTGTFTFELEGNMTCTSTENIVGTVDIVWSDNTESHAEVTTFVLDLGSAGGAAGLTATVVSGRFAGDDLRIVNLRDPRALLRCVLHGLSQATGTTSLTFTQPL
ncbi:MAG: hypothetical protein ABUT39_24360 [Acidobacteriota bacterium]